MSGADPDALFVSDVGQGPPVVLLHGAGLDHAMWSGVQAEMAFAGRRTLALDLPGNGRSGLSPPRTIEDAAETVGVWLRAADMGPAAVVGFSMGALVALNVAATFPDHVRALGLAGVAARMPVHPKLLAAAKAQDASAFQMVATWGHARKGLVSESVQALSTGRPGALYAGLEACNAYGDAQQAASRVRCPTLLLLGGSDRMTPADGATPLAQAIPSARTTVIAGSGHMIFAEEPKAAVAALLAVV